MINNANFMVNNNVSMATADAADVTIPISAHTNVPTTNVTVPMSVPTTAPNADVTLPTSIPTSVTANDSTVLTATANIFKFPIEAPSFCNEMLDLVVDGSSLNEEKNQKMKLDVIVNDHKKKIWLTETIRK